MAWSSGRLNRTAPKLGAMDLNLLVVFDAIMRDRSVTRAGERLGLSQPAMSHALTRLRHMLKDELFVRSPNGMMPTPRAELLATPIRIALDGLQQSLEPDQFVVVHRKGHPAAKAREFSTEKLAELPLLEISSAQFGTDFLETGPAKSKSSTKPAMRAPFLSAAQILATSDLVSVLPLNVAKNMTRSHELVFRRLSRSPRPIEAAMIWLRRLDNQPAHAWLRDVVSHTSRGLRSP